MRKIRYLTAILLVSATLGASPPKPQIQACKNQVISLLDKWKSQNIWRHQKPSVYFSPTDKFGSWIQFNQDANNYYISKANERSEIQITITKKGCSSELEILKRKEISYKLSDKKLRKQIQKGRGIIYLWSPKMNLSYRGYKNIKKLTKRKQLKLITYVDPETTKEELIKYPISMREKTNSYELRMRNVYLHYPSVLAFENGRIINRINYGYESEEEYEVFITSAFR